MARSSGPFSGKVVHFFFMHIQCLLFTRRGLVTTGCQQTFRSSDNRLSLDQKSGDNLLSLDLKVC